MRSRPSWGAFRLISLGVAAIFVDGAATADSFRSGYTYGSAAGCAASGRYPSQICANAAKNAAAEFEEKAPRFSSRDACERALRAPCAIGFTGASGWSGRKGAVYFTPRQQGFRLNTAANGHDVTVTPVAGSLTFSTRSAVRLDVAISPQASRFWTYQPAPAFRPGQPAGAEFGVATPDGAKGEVPPKPPVDPNFDCAAYLDPAAGGDPSTGCAPVPLRRR
jgi:hypothetical protein